MNLQDDSDDDLHELDIKAEWLLVCWLVCLSFDEGWKGGVWVSHWGDVFPPKNFEKFLFQKGVLFCGVGKPLLRTCTTLVSMENHEDSVHMGTI